MNMYVISGHYSRFDEVEAISCSLSDSDGEREAILHSVEATMVRSTDDVKARE